MSFKVTYIGKDGKQASLTFATLPLATMYSQTVKHPTLTEIDVQAPTIEVKQCRDKESGVKREPTEKEKRREQEEDTYIDVITGVVISGGTSSEALDAGMEAVHNVIKEDETPEIVCGCGKSLRKGSTICYMCRRYR